MKITMDTSDCHRWIKDVKSSYPRMMGMVGDLATSFFVDNFRRGGFLNSSLETWTESQKDDGSATLIESGALRNSIHKTNVNSQSVTIKTDGVVDKYADIHNEGGRIYLTEKVRKGLWAKFYKTKNVKYKYMALSKKDYLEIPQRQYMGESVSMMRDIDKLIEKFIEDIK